MSKSRIITVVVLGLLVVGAQAIAQTAADQIPAYYVQDQITSPSLQGNVLGDPATRPLLVYLPPSYGKEPQRRYPTIYFLHGFGGKETDFASGGGIGSLATEMVAAGKMGEVIIVLPNASNAYGGSWFARNPLTGDFRCISPRAGSVGTAETISGWRDAPRKPIRGRNLSILVPM
jgi:hypothetical protein